MYLLLGPLCPFFLLRGGYVCELLCFSRHVKLYFFCFVLTTRFVFTTMFTWNFPRSLEFTGMATAPTISPDERKLIIEALALLLKSHERAARASSGVVSAAHEGEAAIVRNLANKVMSGALL